jgi:hypothetical protein
MLQSADVPFERTRKPHIGGLLNVSMPQSADVPFERGRLAITGIISMPQSADVSFETMCPVFIEPVSMPQSANVLFEPIRWHVSHDVIATFQCLNQREFHLNYDTSFF